MTNLLRVPYDLVRPIYEMTSFHRAVIEEVCDHDLRDAYHTCRGITRSFAKTFYFATRFLPNHKQRSIFAIYSLCRYVDNLMDETQDLITGERLDVAESDARLKEFRRRLYLAYDGRLLDDPILHAFTDVLRSSRIPIELPLELIEGVRMDLTKTRYATFEEVYDYSYKVASVVGLMTSEVFGYSDREALTHAVDLGIAMQLTNILRDVGEDLTRDRIYLPAEELAAFGVSEEDLFARKLDAPFIRFMQHQVNRARDYYASAAKGVEMLDRDSRLPVWLALENYGRILNKIEENGFDVFSNRAHLTSAEKFTIIPRILYRIKKSA